MFVPPIIERELRVALRRHKSQKSRLKTAAIGAAVVCFFLLLSLLGGGNGWGSQLHLFLFFGGLYLAVIPPITICAGLFCEERRNQTLELLYLAGMDMPELFLGKLLSGGLIASNDLLALAPLLAVPFLSGGISLDLFLATIACFPVLLLFVTSVCVLASVLCRDDGAALACAVIMGGAICLALPLPYYLGLAVAGAPPFASHWLCLSPAYAPYLVAKHFAGEKPRVFWQAAASTLIFSLLCVSAAAFILSRNWRQEIVRPAPAGWRGWWKTWLHGSRQWRDALRRRVLPLNAFQWLAEQDRPPVAMAWAWVAGITTLWFLGFAAWPRVWPSPVNFYLTALLLMVGLSRIIAYAAARRIGLDRRDGVLELLLTTPLNPEQIIDGQSAALVEQFRPVRFTILALCVAMMAAGFLTRSWTTGAVVSYILIWCFFFGWCLLWHDRKASLPMWIALNTGRPASAIFVRLQNGWTWLWLVFNARNLARGAVFAGHFPSGSPLELCIVVLIFVVSFILVAAQEANAPTDDLRKLFISDLRFIARQPVPERNDPRFKKWNGRQRLPMNTRQYMESYPDPMARPKVSLIHRNDPKNW